MFERPSPSANKLLFLRHKDPRHEAFRVAFQEALHAGNLDDLRSEADHLPWHGPPPLRSLVQPRYNYNVIFSNAVPRLKWNP